GLATIADTPGDVLVVPDALDLARLAATAGPCDDPGAPVRDVCHLAREGRLVCLRTGEELVQAAGLPSTGDTLRCDPGDLPAQGEQLLVRLRGLPGGATMADPGGLAARVRGAVACGAAAASGLYLDPAARDEVIEQCRAIAD